MHVSAPFSALYRRVQYFSAPGRCVVKMHAVSGSAVKRFFRTCASVFSSSAEVASSRSRIGAPRSTARAMAMRCACPSESPPPCSAIFVFTPFGSDDTNAHAQAVLSAAVISSSVAFSFAMRRFSAIVPENSVLPCGTYENAQRVSALMTISHPFFPRSTARPLSG